MVLPQHFQKAPEVAADGSYNLGQVGAFINANFRKVVAVINFLSYLTPGMADVGPALMQAQQDALAQGKDLYIPYVEGGLPLATTVDWLPLPGRTEYGINVNCLSTFNWVGPAGVLSGGKNPGKAVFYVCGMRNSRLVNIVVKLPKLAGLQNVICWDVDTLAKGERGYAEGTNSTSHIEWVGGACILGDGKNNKGMRWGHISGHGGDISNCHVVKMTFYGDDGGSVGLGGLASLGFIKDSQKGVQNEGRNVLNNTFSNCLFAYLGTAYTAERGAVDVTQEQYGGPNDGGNGALIFDQACVFSHVNLCFKFTCPQNYTIRDCRAEDCRSIYYHTDGVDKPMVLFSNFIADNCYTNRDDGQGNLFYMGRPGSLILENVFCVNHEVVYGPECVRVYSYSGQKGSLQVRGGAFRAAPTFYAAGNEAYTPYIQGVANIGYEGSQMVTLGMFADTVGGANPAGGSTLDVSRFFLEYGPNVYIKNDGGNVIYQAGGQDFMEATPNKVYTKKPFVMQGYDFEFDTVGTGPVVKAPNGSKFRLSVTNEGQPQFTPVV